MSPWASASPISTLVTADLLVHDAAELLGDAEHVDAELVRLGEQLRRASRGRRRPPARPGAASSSAKSRTASWSICCSSSGVRSKRPARLARRLARRVCRAVCAALKVRPAAVAERKPFLVPWKSARSTCLRMRMRSSRSEPASRLSARRPRPMLRSAMPLSCRCGGHSTSSRSWVWSLSGSHAAVEVGRAASLRRAPRSDLLALGVRCELDPAPAAGSACGSATSTAKASGRRLSSAARQRALVHMPCAIAPGKPSGFAVSACMWIGLRSPETAA